MKAMIMVTADYADGGMNGKFNLVGAGFTDINTRKIPLMWPLMFLFVRLKFTKQDKGLNKINVRLMGEKGALAKIEMNINLEFKDGNPSEGYINIPWRLVNTKFEYAGEYKFELDINGEPELNQALTVKLLPETQPV